MSDPSNPTVERHIAERLQIIIAATKDIARLSILNCMNTDFTRFATPVG